MALVDRNDGTPISGTGGNVARAFDRNTATYWSDGYTTSNEYIGQDYGTEYVNIIEVRVNQSTSDRGMKNVKVQGWNGSAWVNIPITSATNATRVDDYTYQLVRYGDCNLILNNISTYTKYNVHYYSKYHVSSVRIAEVYFYEEENIDKTTTAAVTHSLDHNSNNIESAYTGDNNDNNSAQIRYGIGTNFGSWENMTADRINDKHIFAITGLKTNTSYNYEIKYTDSDGVE